MLLLIVYLTFQIDDPMRKFMLFLGLLICHNPSKYWYVRYTFLSFIKCEDSNDVYFQLKFLIFKQNKNYQKILKIWVSK